MRDERDKYFTSLARRDEAQEKKPIPGQIVLGIRWS
jgi:hypothetical protein